MANFKELRRCFGCGEILQSNDEEAPGYIPEKAIDNRKIIICRRCFRLQHYSEDIKDKLAVTEDYFKILKQAREEKAMFIYVIDLFSFESSFIVEVNRYIKGSTVVLVANKRDVLPKSVSDEKLVAYVKTRAEEAGLIVKDVIITSSKKNYNIDEVKSAIATHSKNQNIYVIGSTSSGKSTMINAFLKNFTNETDRFITTSCYPNTTMRVIAIPLNGGAMLYDTPGLSADNSMIMNVEKEVIKTITPNKEIKARVYQLLPKQSLFFGGVGRFDFVEGEKTNFTVYMSNEIEIHRTKLENANSAFSSLVKGKRLKPISSKIVDEKDLDVYEIVVDAVEKHDIGIYGLGWVSFTGNGQIIRVHAPKGVSVYSLSAKI